MRTLTALELIEDMLARHNVQQLHCRQGRMAFDNFQALSERLHNITIVVTDDRDLEIVRFLNGSALAL